MTEIYEVIKNSHDLNDYNKFILMLDSALEKIGGKKQSQKIDPNMGKSGTYIVKWIRQDKSYTGPQRYVWINFKDFMKSYFVEHWGNYVTQLEFYEKFFLPYLRNYYQISDDKEIKLESVSIENINLKDELAEDDYEESYNFYSNKKGITKCIVFSKLDSHTRGWVSSENLKNTILNFIKYYFQCKDSSCNNLKFNDLTIAKDGYAKMTCRSCSNSKFIEIKS